jgi:hypothetical protein
MINNYDFNYNVFLRGKIRTIIMISLTMRYIKRRENGKVYKTQIKDIADNRTKN